MYTLYWNDTPLTFPTIRHARRFVSANAHTVGYAVLRGATACLALDADRIARKRKNARHARQGRKDTRGY